MKILGDFFSSIIGNTKTRIRDPFIGTFFISWIICNWNYLAILLWGEESLTQRVKDFHRYITSSDFFELNSIFFLPLIISTVYLFLFPWLSFIIKHLQIVANNKLHKQAVDIDLSQIIQQEKLNKAKLRADPDKTFLAQSVQIDLDRKKHISEQCELRTSRFKAKNKEAIARAEEAESKKNIAALDESKKKNQADLERQKFNVSSAELRSTLSSHRFPSAFLFISSLSESFEEDGITLSLNTLCNVVTAIFGYDSFQLLLEDKKFDNESLSNVKYIFYDESILANKLDEISSYENKNITSEMLFSNIQIIFEDLPYKFVNIEELTQLSIELCENNSFDLLESDEVCGTMAESDTIYDEVYIEGAESPDFNDGFTVSVKASASGSHRKEDGIPGRDMNIVAEVYSKARVGKFGLGELEIGDISSNLIDYWEEEV
ncbi:hypothetical protein EBI01_15335 [Marinomonas rhizomae]|uniref:Uncharacterized protein n=1 Tax=Marinomonas rhizomae TaxID=491948 RepID=A0A366IY27_9GAMM|nr:hypothetical protein [Marinomonas rhizomae]RBP79592.1 hypothetical protein DFP80_11348 [Marinomonas rhizomae]RNF71592.1 hypothetical protein EBI01_15335 [Marinomonas rhizomae]